MSIKVCAETISNAFNLADCRSSLAVDGSFLWRVESTRQNPEASDGRPVAVKPQCLRRPVRQRLNWAIIADIQLFCLLLKCGAVTALTCTSFRFCQVKLTSMQTCHTSAVRLF